MLTITRRKRQICKKCGRHYVWICGIIPSSQDRADGGLCDDCRKKDQKRKTKNVLENPRLC